MFGWSGGLSSRVFATSRIHGVGALDPHLDQVGGQLGDLLGDLGAGVEALDGLLGRFAFGLVVFGGFHDGALLGRHGFQRLGAGFDLLGDARELLLDDVAQCVGRIRFGEEAEIVAVGLERIVFQVALGIEIIEADGAVVAGLDADDGVLAGVEADDLVEVDLTRGQGGEIGFQHASGLGHVATELDPLALGQHLDLLVGQLLGGVLGFLAQGVGHALDGLAIAGEHALDTAEQVDGQITDLGADILDPLPELLHGLLEAFQGHDGLVGRHGADDVQVFQGRNAGGIALQLIASRIDEHADRLRQAVLGDDAHVVFEAIEGFEHLVGGFRGLFDLFDGLFGLVLGLGHFFSNLDFEIHRGFGGSGLLIVFQNSLHVLRGFVEKIQTHDIILSLQRAVVISKIDICSSIGNVHIANRMECFPNL